MHDCVTSQGACRDASRIGRAIIDERVTRRWENARWRGAFAEELTKEMEHRFPTIATGDSCDIWLLPLSPLPGSTASSILTRSTQPGEPVVSKWEFEDTRRQSPASSVHFKANDRVSDISLEIAWYSDGRCGVVCWKKGNI
ncbi:MAG: hypothetical protein ACLVEJ_00675 [Parabacteroides sp.]